MGVTSHPPTSPSGGGWLVSVTSGSQGRAFTYDGRGLLTAEQHPELELNGNGSASYSEYDSRGHAHRKTIGSIELETTFDLAERVEKINDASVTPSRPFKQFAYTNGRLTGTGRWNYDALLGDPALADDRRYVGVTEGYQYDTAGRLARRDTAVGTTSNFDGLDFFFSRTYNDLSEIDGLTYPCRKAPGGAYESSDPARQLVHGYADALLSSVGEPAMYASAITYHPNGMLKSVTHGEGSQRVFETWTADPDGMSRPKRIAATNPAGAELWSTGDYTYDGAGNIKAMGQTSYLYDALQRLVQSTTVTPLGKSTMTGYGYDSFGNRLYETSRTCSPVNGRIVCGSPTYIARSVTGTTNHYGDATYDDAGNVTTDRGRTFSYDPLGMMTRAQMEGRDFHYLYTADDQRIAVVERINAKTKTTWSVRDFDNRVLRLWTDDKTSGTRVITWKEDPIYRGSALLANVSPSGTKHYSLDHLGSPRLVTEVTGVVKGLQAFSDYGVGGTTDGGALQYTGHERDKATFGSGSADLPDYFHARYYDFAAGRFLSVDPVLDAKKALMLPRLWNRYAYVVNNPIVFADPTGREVALPATCASNIPCKEIPDLRNGLPPALRLFVRAQKLSDGRVVLNKGLINSVRDTHGSMNFMLLRGAVNHHETVYAVSSKSTAMRFDFNTRTNRPVDFAQDRGLLGVTWPSSLSGFDVSVAQVNPFQSTRDAAATMAHELYGHAYSCMEGKPCGHTGIPRAIFDALENEAYANFDQKP